ncbi:protein ALP1-like [Aphis craccivora]|uniref:Protein ALP1-like n=1 Tax=Aphis craccivora TaxID=307492 RepID=A0A6G0ZD06_APHCR|nr:protein ALP1-like [Aphis craccivora]
MELLELLDDVDLVCVALAADTVERQRVRWVHPLNAQRITLGESHYLYFDLRKYLDRIFNYYHMSIKSFDELVVLMRPRISETSSTFRETIDIKKRLTVTLR